MLKGSYNTLGTIHIKIESFLLRQRKFDEDFLNKKPLKRQWQWIIGKG